MTKWQTTKTTELARGRRTSRSGGTSGAARPDPEVLAKPKRRQFGAAYKLKIVEEADACTEPGAIAALLRVGNVLGTYRVTTHWPTPDEERPEIVPPLRSVPGQSH